MGEAKERLDPYAGDVDEIQSILHIDRYEHAVNEVSGRILDVACGLGYGSRILYSSRAVDKSVVAFDISKLSISYAKEKYPGPEYMRADAHALPFAGGSFNSVIALEIIEHVNSAVSLLGEIHRVIESKGVLVLSTPNVAHLENRVKSKLLRRKPLAAYPKNPFHKHEYAPHDLVMLLESAGFIIEKKWGQILTFPFVDKLPPRICISTGRFLPELSLHIIYKARKTRR